MSSPHLSFTPMNIKLGHSEDFYVFFWFCCFQLFIRPFWMFSVSTILLEGQTVLVHLFIPAIQQTKRPMVYFDIQMHGLIFKWEGHTTNHVLWYHIQLISKATIKGQCDSILLMTDLIMFIQYDWIMFDCGRT